jgi:flagellar assembly protein FliH
MLSKVIGRGDAGNVQALVFPQITGYERGKQDRGPSADSRNTAGQDECAALRERVQQIESQGAADTRQAFESGRQQGEKQAAAELQPVLERLNASITQVLAMRPELRRRAERDAVQLALLIARRVLNRQLSVDEEALTAIARVAFERLSRAESYRVTLHPRFAAAIGAAVPASYSARVRIDPDPDCAPGTLILHSAEGTIDASVDAQLEEISRGLSDRISNA